MKLTLGDIYGSDKTLLAKYPEPGKDTSHGEEFNFYAGTYGPHVIHSEEARFLPIIGKQLKVLMGEGVLHPEMIEYYKSIYPESFSDENIIPYSGSSYYGCITEEVKNKTLITLHPYSKIDMEKYHLDPNLIFDLNDKTQMNKLTNKTPNSANLKLEEIKEINNFPFVLKAKSGASGDGVRIIYDAKCLEDALIWFGLEKELMVEEYIEYQKNIGVQILVSNDGNVKIIGLSEQSTSKEGEYEGSIINNSEQLEEEAKQIAIEVGKNAASMGFIGVAGLDMLKSKEGNYYLIDPNFRLTGASTLFLLNSQLQAETGKKIFKVQSFKSNHPDIGTMIVENTKLGKELLYLLSAFKNTIDGVISGYAIHAGDTKKHLVENAKFYKNNGFKL